VITEADLEPGSLRGDHRRHEHGRLQSYHDESGAISLGGRKREGDGDDQQREHEAEPVVDPVHGAIIAPTQDATPGSAGLRLRIEPAVPGSLLEPVRARAAADLHVTKPVLRAEIRSW
jgi:hypothetical protein